MRFSNNCPIAFSPRNGRYSNLPPIHSYRNCRKLVLDNNNCYSDESSCSHHSSSCDTFPRYTRKSPLACYNLDKRNKQPPACCTRLGILVAAVTKKKHLTNSAGEYLVGCTVLTECVSADCLGKEQDCMICTLGFLHTWLTLPQSNRNMCSYGKPCIETTVPVLKRYDEYNPCMSRED